MEKKPTCGSSEGPSPRRLGATDAVVIIVILVIAALMSAAARMPLDETLLLLLGAGCVGVLVTALATRDGTGNLVTRMLSVLARQ